MNYLERFLGVMEYKNVDHVPNWEHGLWEQTRKRWQEEGLDPGSLHLGTDTFLPGEPFFDMDPREFVHFNCDMMPCFEYEIIEEDNRTITYRDIRGKTRKALKEGSIGHQRICMDQYLDFPVHNMADWQELKKRYDPQHPQRYEQNWETLRVAGWKQRKHPLVFPDYLLGWGFYWMARGWMGTENLSYAWYDQPKLLHDMMEFVADFMIEAGRPVLEKTSVEYLNFDEDLSMKTGPLLSPATYKEFILPRLKRVIEFYKSHGVKYVALDSDGNPEDLIPMMMDAGVDVIWPLERAAGSDPTRLRKKFGKSLRLWGGIDKRALMHGPKAIDEHLKTFRPLLEEGGFIPHVDHLVSPDVSYDNFLYYMESKAKLLGGKL